MPPLLYAAMNPYFASDTMASASDAGNSVAITLRQVNPAGGFNRRITLRPDKPVSVGRSSRSEAKNLSASVDNALFACPVVSRAHAELELKVSKWTVPGSQVLVKDCNSMHGTSVNGQKLLAHKPFQLFLGDTVRLGESVSRADNSYDGVTLEVENIETLEPNAAAPVKIAQPGISCPSDSESDFDDDSSVEEVQVQSSSVHTTPEQATANVEPQKPKKSSPSVVIELDDDDDDVEHEPVITAPRASLQDTTVVQDTYAESEMPVEATGTPVAPGYVGVSEDFFDEASDEEDAYNSDEDDPYGDGELWSTQDPTSGVDQSAISDDEDAGSAIADIDSNDAQPSNVDNPDGDVEDDEGPEIMSSKREPSHELGTLGEEAGRDVPTRDSPAPVRPHYDPVRGFQAPAYGIDPVNNPSAKTAVLPRSSKWDIGPDGSATYDFNPRNMYSYGVPPYNPPSYTAYQPGLNNQQTRQDGGLRFNWTVFPPPAPSHPLLETPVFGFPSQLSQEMSHPVTANTDGLKGCFSGTSEEFSAEATESSSFRIVGTKRKAADITADTDNHTAKSTGFEEAGTQTHFEPQAAEDDAVRQELANAAKEPEPEPKPKKRKIKQPRARKSLLRSTVTEVGKYAAGALVGGVGLVALLASPLGARLADC
ncbi:hypothetical protein WHR41_00820 [Cladosporium halotolerans]|uniref:FHA domain-containing protein n=1 Tax=Cladosporium halotolerans TaxID=1052096 RepID=A0AB34L034_9PEZI